MEGKGRGIEVVVVVVVLVREGCVEGRKSGRGMRYRIQKRLRSD
jgi:hypothetical protein